jgi:hypothetical protein
VDSHCKRQPESPGPVDAASLAIEHLPVHGLPLRIQRLGQVEEVAEV